MSLESTLKYCQLPPDAEEKTESEFRDLLDSCRTAYTIPAAAFDSYKVKRGLREPDGNRRDRRRDPHRQCARLCGQRG